MFKLIKNFWKAHDDNEVSSSGINDNASFVLKWKNLPIGELSFRNDRWKFVYSEEFINQDKLATLIDFPNKNKVYESTELWPIFESRIPGSNQTKVIHMRHKLGDKELSEVQLLKLFGERNIDNPFVLISLDK